MPAPKNPLKAQLKSGEATYGCWLALADAYAAHIAATAEFDWLLIDGEHAPNDLRTMLAQLIALEGGGPAPIVRLPDGDTVRIKQALDIGAQSLLIPMVASAKQARSIVAATRYPPEGVRGVGAALGRASRYGLETDYLRSAGDEICLLLQVENRAGLAALDEILAVEGVDGVFIGPADLAADMGFDGPDDVDARRQVIDALARIKVAGLVAGTLGFSHDYIAEARSAGATFLGVGVDVLLLADALRTRAKAWRI